MSAKNFISYLYHTENFIPPFAQIVLPVHQPPSDEQSIAITPAMSESYACYRALLVVWESG
jgi:hypothetical protein